jgi:unsaturated chondroitin disaccharide hydrolase
VDSLAAAIAAQGILRLGTWLNESTHVHDAWKALPPPSAVAAATGPGQAAAVQPGVSADRQPERISGDRYVAAALTIAQTLLGPTYLSTDDAHQGILLHSVYHRPGGWDYVAPGQTVPNGESSMWGDYHALELGVMLKRLADGRPHQHFFDVRDRA